MVWDPGLFFFGGVLMGIVGKDDMVAIRREDGNIVCEECATQEEWDNATEDQIVTRSEIENDSDNLYFCDECKKQI